MDEESSLNGIIYLWVSESTTSTLKFSCRKIVVVASVVAKFKGEKLGCFNWVGSIDCDKGL